jgi:hypothetical protein
MIFPNVENWKELRYDLATFKGAHNAYEIDMPLSQMVASPSTQLHNGRARNLEFDLFQKKDSAVIWSVSHDDYDENARNLTSWMIELAQVVRADPQRGPLTVHFDLKNVEGSHATVANELDARIRAAFDNDATTTTTTEALFFSPADLLAHQSAASNVNDAARRGWPLLGAMLGRVVCVLSGNLQSFKMVYNQRASRLCFTDRAPDDEAGVLEQDDFVFANFKIKDVVSGLKSEKSVYNCFLLSI